MSIIFQFYTASHRLALHYTPKSVMLHTPTLLSRDKNDKNKCELPE